MNRNYYTQNSGYDRFSYEQGNTAQGYSNNNIRCNQFGNNQPSDQRGSWTQNRQNYVEQNQFEFHNTTNRGHQEQIDWNNRNEEFIEMAIYDRSADDGKICGKRKRKLLTDALFQMIYNELLSEADIKPRFQQNTFINDVYRLVAVDQSSAEYLKSRVPRIPPPWDNARLEVEYHTKETNVEAYVPGPWIPVEQLFAALKQFDPKVDTSKWILHKTRPHGKGHVFTFGIDMASFIWLEKCNGFIPYMQTEMEFRVLSDEVSVES